jgi:hypothetical protein
VCKPVERALFAKRFFLSNDFGRQI